MAKPESAGNCEENFAVSWENREIRTAIAARLRECANLVGGPGVLAEKADVKRRTLDTYLAGDAEPKATALARIARAAGVTVDWILPVAPSEAPRANEVRESMPPYGAGTALDMELLQNLVAFVEEGLREKSTELPPEKKAEFIAKLYNYFRERRTEEADQSNVIRFLDFYIGAGNG